MYLKFNIPLILVFVLCGMKTANCQFINLPYNSVEEYLLIKNERLNSISNGGKLSKWELTNDLLIFSDSIVWVVNYVTVDSIKEKSNFFYYKFFFKNETCIKHIEKNSTLEKLNKSVIHDLKGKWFIDEKLNIYSKRFGIKGKMEKISKPLYNYQITFTPSIITENKLSNMKRLKKRKLKKYF